MRNTVKSHDELVKQVARHLKRRFYRSIHACAEGFPEPEEVAGDNGGVRPDVTVLARGSEVHVLEVETPQTLAEAEVARRWAALARFAAGQEGKFTLVVPKGAGGAARSRLQELRIDAGVWEL